MADEPITKPPEEQTREELEAAILAEQAKLNAPPVEEPKPDEKPVIEDKTKWLEYRSADGTVYTAESQEELFKKVTSGLEHTKAALKDRERQIHDLRKPPAEKPAEQPDIFDREKYFKLMEDGADGPVKAARYLKKYDGTEKTEQVIQEVVGDRQAARAAEALRDEVLSFYASPAGQQYVKVETPELDKRMSDYLTEKQLPVNASNLVRAYYELRDDGQIPMEPASGGKVKPKAPPDSAKGGGGAPQDQEPDYSRMSKDELAAHLRSKGLDVSYAR